MLPLSEVPSGPDCRQKLPRSASTRSRMFSRPEPVSDFEESNPRPSSRTWKVNLPFPFSIVSHA